MKILIVVSGIGFGDATREDANIQAIKKHIPSAKIIIAGYDNSYLYFHKKYKTIKIRGYKLPGKAMRVNIIPFLFRNILLPGFWFRDTLKVTLQSLNFIPDIIISDFEPVGISLAKVLQRPCIVIFGYDPELFKEYKKHFKVNYKMKTEAAYFEKLYAQADHVLIPTFKENKKQHLDHRYISPALRSNPEDLPSEKSIMQKLGLKKKPILVLLGGSNFGMKLAKHINTLAPGTKENYIIIGGNITTPLHENVKHLPYTKDILKYLKTAKGIITLAGQQTLIEALAYKKPILSFPIQDHIEQTLNAYALEQHIQISYTHSFSAVKTALAHFLKTLRQQKHQLPDIKTTGPEELIEFLKTIQKV